MNKFKKNNQKAIQLLSQIIQIQEVIEKQNNARAIAEHRGSQSAGDSMIYFHMKVLKELLEDNDNYVD